MRGTRARSQRFFSTFSFLMMATTATAEAQPEVLLVHGAWHGSWVFEALASRLRKAGIVVRAVDLPSVGTNRTADLAADAAVVREALAERPGVSTVVVGHSYGGLVISEAAEGFPHVIGLVYMCAFLLDKGLSLAGAEGSSKPAWAILDETGRTLLVPKDPASIFFSRCPPAVAQEASARLLPHSAVSFASPQTGAAWRTVPNVYLLCELDQAIPPVAQEAMAAHAQRVLRFGWDHSPFLSATEELAEVLIHAIHSFMRPSSSSSSSHSQ